MSAGPQSTVKCESSCSQPKASSNSDGCLAFAFSQELDRRIQELRKDTWSKKMVPEWLTLPGQARLWRAAASMSKTQTAETLDPIGSGKSWPDMLSLVQLLFDSLASDTAASSDFDFVRFALKVLVPALWTLLIGNRPVPLDLRESWRDLSALMLQSVYSKQSMGKLTFPSPTVPSAVCRSLMVAACTQLLVELPNPECEWLSKSVTLLTWQATAFLANYTQELWTPKPVSSTPHGDEPTPEELNIDANTARAAVLALQQPQWLEGGHRHIVSMLLSGAHLGAATNFDIDTMQQIQSFHGRVLTPVEAIAPNLEDSNTVISTMIESKSSWQLGVAYVSMLGMAATGAINRVHVNSEIAVAELLQIVCGASQEDISASKSAASTIDVEDGFTFTPLVCPGLACAARFLSPSQPDDWRVRERAARICQRLLQLCAKSPSASKLTPVCQALKRILFERHILEANKTVRSECYGYQDLIDELRAKWHQALKSDKPSEPRAALIRRVEVLSSLVSQEKERGRSSIMTYFEDGDLSVLQKALSGVILRCKELKAAAEPLMACLLSMQDKALESSVHSFNSLTAKETRQFEEKLANPRESVQQVTKKGIINCRGFIALLHVMAKCAKVPVEKLTSYDCAAVFRRLGVYPPTWAHPLPPKLSPLHESVSTVDELFRSSSEKATLIVTYSWTQPLMQLAELLRNKMDIWIDIFCVDQRRSDIREALAAARELYSTPSITHICIGGTRMASRGWCLLELMLHAMSHSFRTPTKFHMTATQSVYIIRHYFSKPSQDFFGTMQCTVTTDLEAIKAEVMRAFPAEQFNLFIRNTLLYSACTSLIQHVEMSAADPAQQYPKMVFLPFFETVVKAYGWDLNEPAKLDPQRADRVLLAAWNLIGGIRPFLRLDPKVLVIAKSALPAWYDSNWVHSIGQSVPYWALSELPSLNEPPNWTLPRPGVPAEVAQVVDEPSVSSTESPEARTKLQAKRQSQGNNVVKQQSVVKSNPNRKRMEASGPIPTVPKSRPNSSSSSLPPVKVASIATATSATSSKAQPSASKLKNAGAMINSLANHGSQKRVTASARLLTNKK